MPGPPNSPGGRLMWWMTRRSIAQPAGRSSQLGEATYFAPATSPSRSTRSFGLLGLGVELVVDAEPLHAIAQRAESDAQHLGGGGAVVARLLQRREYRLPLHRVEALLQRQSRGGRGRRRRSLLGGREL